MGAPALTRPVPTVASSLRLAHVFVNPMATRLAEQELAASIEILRGAFSVEVLRTEGPGHATALAREAARSGAAVVVAAGGDGTFSETAAGLAGSETALACLPMGCTNVFARSVGSPRRPLAAARRLAGLEAAGAPKGRRVDLGTVNGRPFLCTSGVGFSASMTAAVDAVPERKARLGQLQFVASAASELGRRYLRNPPRMSVRAGGRSAEGVTAVVQNSHALTYFGPREIQACAAAGLDTGAISLTLLRRALPRDVPPVLARLVSSLPVSGHSQVESFPSVAGASVVSVDGRPLPLEADGEFLGEHLRIEYGVAPGALRVLV